MTDQPTPKTATTEYVILRQHLAAAPSAQPSGPARPTEQWDRVGTVNARSAEHAIRQHAEKHTD